MDGSGMKNLGSFVNNGLESLWIEFQSIPISDIMGKNAILNAISNLFEQNDEKQSGNDERVTAVNNFILKVNMLIDCGIGNFTTATGLAIDLFKLHSLLMSRFKNATLAFNIDYGSCATEDHLFDTLRSVYKNMVGRYIDKDVDAKYCKTDSTTRFSVVVKNTRKLDKTVSSFDTCHVEPKYEYGCEWCEPVPWLSSS